MAVGVFDSGLGGLTVHREIKRLMPDVPLVYFCDNANAPYGERDAEDIFQLTKSATEYLWDNGCDLVVLACNTASAIGLRRLQREHLPKGKHVLGVFVPMIEALTDRQWADEGLPQAASMQQLALFATAATVASRAFQRELSFRAIGVDVEAQPCRGLVDAIETGDDAVAHALVHQYVAALIKNQAELVANSLQTYLQRHPRRSGGGEQQRFICSSDPQKTSVLASRLLAADVLFEAC